METDQSSNGVRTDDEIKRLSRICTENHVKRGYKPTHEEQLAELLKLVHALRKMPIAVHVESLNSQMYETPSSMLKYVFGSLVKDSACYFKDESMTLDEAEIAMLELYCERAQIKDGHSVLDLGCGWGALTLYVAKKYKRCHVTAITNSTTQRDYIMEKSKSMNLPNVEVILADMTKHETDKTYDRVFVIEVFEHMKNYELLLRKISKWMTDDGFLFIQHACHKTFTDHFEPDDEDDHGMTEDVVPTGTVLVPSASLLLYFQDDVSVVNHWILSGKNYSRSCEEWFKRLKANTDTILEAHSDNQEAAKNWIDYWRIYTLSAKDLFGYNNGEEYMTSHLLFKKK